jgi:hypothetical protein
MRVVKGALAGDHDNMRGPFDLGDGGAHAVVAEAVHARVDAPVGRREHGPDRTAAPGRGGCRLAERNAGEGALGDRVQRRIGGGDVGAVSGF